jgi:putative glutamine amidotransferase
MGPRPRIVTTLSTPNGDAQRALSRERYLAALAVAGCAVLAVDAATAVPDAFDGLCLTGGEDVEPARYGAQADPRTEPADPERDALELALLGLARERDLPVLGICRGFQVINVAYGGRLVQHIEGHRERNGPIVAHRVAPPAGSKLALACGTAEHAVNARHHQGVRPADLAPGLVPTVHIDGLVEAYEDPARQWLVAVQWHPERDDVDPAAKGIFGAFAAAAARQPARAR